MLYLLLFFVICLVRVGYSFLLKRLNEYDSQLRLAPLWPVHRCSRRRTWKRHKTLHFQVLTADLLGLLVCNLILKMKWLESPWSRVWPSVDNPVASVHSWWEEWSTALKRVLGSILMASFQADLSHDILCTTEYLQRQAFFETRKSRNPQQQHTCK